MSDTKEETDIGDGVLASLKMGQIMLRTSRSGAGDNIIFLEMETYEALRAFARKVGFEVVE